MLTSTTAERTTARTMSTAKKIPRRSVLGDPEKYLTMCSQLLNGSQDNEARSTELHSPRLKTPREQQPIQQQRHEDVNELHLQLNKLSRSYNDEEAVDGDADGEWAQRYAQSTIRSTRLEGVLQGADPLNRTRKQFSDQRQQRALERWNRAQEEWRKVGKRLALKFGKDTTSLIMNRSGPKHRAKQEEIDMIESSVPPHIRHGARSWEMSLRSNNGKGESYVRLGSGWPYPIWCPVKETRNRTFETIRKPDEDVNHASSILGVRDMGSPYARQYQRYIKKTVEFDPLDTLGGLKIEAKKVPTHGTVKNSARFSEWNLSVSDIEYTPLKFDSKEDHDQKQRKQKKMDDAPSQDSARWQGPRLELEKQSLVFYTVPRELSAHTVAVSNVGSCALQFQWERCKPVGVLQAKRSAGKFQLSTESKGTLLPNEVKEFSFSFQSEQEGIFTDAYRLLTVPRCPDMDSFRISLRGITKSNISLDSIGLTGKADESTQKSHASSEMDWKDDCNEDDKNEYIRRENWTLGDHRLDGTVSTLDQKRLLFIQRNADAVKEELVTTETVALLERLADRVLAHLLEQDISERDNDYGKDEEEEKVADSDENGSFDQKDDLRESVHDGGASWEFTLDSLRLLILRVTDEEKRSQFMGLFSDIVSIVCPCEEESEAIPVASFTQAQWSLESSIRYCIAYEQLLETLDEISRAGEFLKETIFTSPDSTKTRSKKAAKEAEDVNDEDEKQAIYRSDFTKQTRAIVVGAIDRICTLWDESMERIESTYTEEDNVASQDQKSEVQEQQADSKDSHDDGNLVEDVSSEDNHIGQENDDQ